ncbi:hypothetical protein JCM30471_06560 [Desulfuromonas carbonis]
MKTGESFEQAVVNRIGGEIKGDRATPGNQSDQDAEQQMATFGMPEETAQIREFGQMLEQWSDPGRRSIRTGGRDRR